MESNSTTTIPPLADQLFCESISIASKICSYKTSTNGPKALLCFIRNPCDSYTSYPCSVDLITNGFTALMHCVLSNNVEAVEKVLQCDGSNQINKQNTIGVTSLMLIVRNSAFLSNSSTIIKMLIDSKADLEIKDIIGSNALLVSCISDDRKTGASDESAFLLINAGANINVMSNHKSTLMTLSARYGNEKLVNFLIEKGTFDINHQNGMNTTALIYSIRYHHESIFKKLLEVPGINLNFQDKEGDTALLNATGIFNSEMSKELSKRDSSILEMSRRMAYLLLDKGTNPGIKNKNGANLFNMEFDLIFDYKLYKMEEKMKEEMKQFKLQLYEELYCPSGIGFKKRLENLFKTSEREELLLGQEEENAKKTNNKRKRK